MGRGGLLGGRAWERGLSLPRPWDSVGRAPARIGGSWTRLDCHSWGEPIETGLEGDHREPPRRQGRQAERLAPGLLCRRRAAPGPAAPPRRAQRIPGVDPPPARRGPAARRKLTGWREAVWPPSREPGAARRTPSSVAATRNRLLHRRNQGACARRGPGPLSRVAPLEAVSGDLRAFGGISPRQGRLPPGSRGQENAVQRKEEAHDPGAACAVPSTSHRFPALSRRRRVAPRSGIETRPWEEPPAHGPEG